MKDIISIIVCTYNQEKTIARCLDSILRQHCEVPMEIVIGEDCSTDGTREICEAYRRRHPDIIRLFCSESNKGMPQNYFDCLERARGRYIADLAGDDEWCDDTKLETQRLFLDSHPEAVMVHTDFVRRNERTGETESLAPYPYGTEPKHGDGLARQVIMQGCWPVVHLCTAMYRKDAYLRCKAAHPEFFGTKYPCEDVQLTVLMGYEGTVCYLPRVTLFYAVSDTSISNNPDEEHSYWFDCGCTELMADLARVLRLDTPELRRHLQKRLSFMLWHVFRLGRQDLRRHAIDAATRWGIEPESAMNRLLLFVTSCAALWRPALAFRRIVVDIKRKH